MVSFSIENWNKTMTMGIKGFILKTVNKKNIELWFTLSVKILNHPGQFEVEMLSLSNWTLFLLSTFLDYDSLIFLLRSKIYWIESTQLNRIRWKHKSVELHTGFAHFVQTFVKLTSLRSEAHNPSRKSAKSLYSYCDTQAVCRRKRKTWSGERFLVISSAALIYCSS